MAKSSSKDRPGRIEIQKGPISTDEQYSEQFRREPEHTRRDMENLAMRQSMKTLTSHEPKR